MPLLRLEVSIPVQAAKKELLLAQASKILTELTAKPEAVVMVTLVECAAVLGGRGGPIVFADVRAIGGLDKKTNVALVRALSELFKKELDVDVDRIYFNFIELAATHWGSRGGTVG
jgi:phenylpyruvate tautomerase PptA (4-oxalocrotonate tautomerase family)